MNNVFIDVTILEPKMKHPTIFEAFDNAAEGKAVVIHNDHDPKPLYYQLLGERGNCFSWTYLSSGPEIWEVEIKKNESNADNIGAIASKDMRKAELFKKLGIDFCCGGKRSLEEACLEKGLDIIRVRQQLEDSGKQSATGPQLDYVSWSPSFLADYIVNVHHNYVKSNTPLLLELSDKVAGHHGANNPTLVIIRNKIHQMLDELTSHMKKEEQTLFPLIKQRENRTTCSIVKPEPLRNTIELLERDHDIAGELTKEINDLTRGYQPPTESCNSVALFYRKLAEFENDLLQHVHLENNILFPKAAALDN